MTYEEFPANGTTWIYKGDPARRYVVIGMANVASRHPEHPPQVVYCTEHTPCRLWARTVPDFYRVMTPA